MFAITSPREYGIELTYLKTAFGIELTDYGHSDATNRGGGVLKAKTADLLATALEQFFEDNKLSATDVLGSILGAPVPRNYKKYARIGYKAGIKHALKQMPEPSKKQIAESLAMIEAFKSWPAKMRYLLKNSAKALPRAPGGPKRKLKPDEEGTACAEIVALQAEYGNRVAVERVASKKGVSARTMYRIWRKRQSKEKKS